MFFFRNKIEKKYLSTFLHSHICFLDITIKRHLIPTGLRSFTQNAPRVHTCRPKSIPVYTNMSQIYKKKHIILSCYIFSSIQKRKKNSSKALNSCVHGMKVTFWLLTQRSLFQDKWGSNYTNLNSNCFQWKKKYLIFSCWELTKHII